MEHGKSKTCCKSPAEINQLRKTQNPGPAPPSHTVKSAEFGNNFKLQEAQQKYKNTAVQLHNELEKCRNELKEKLQTNELLQQEIIDLDKKKQTIIAEFYGYYRKVNTNLKLQSKLEEHIEFMSDFFKNTNKLKETIRVIATNKNWETLEMTLDTYQNGLEELENIKRRSVQSIEILKKFEDYMVVQGIKEFKSNPILDVHITLCREKQSSMSARKNDLLDGCDKLETAINNEKFNTMHEQKKLKGNFVELAKQVKFDISYLRNEESVWKDQATLEISAQQNFIKSLAMKLNQKKAELDHLQIEGTAVQEDIAKLVVQREEADISFRDVEVRIETLKEIIARLNSLVENRASEFEKVQSTIESKTTLLEELKNKTQMLKARKEELREKQKQLHSVYDNKKKLLQLRNELIAKKQKAQQLRETMVALQREQEVKESRVRVLKTEVYVSGEELKELLKKTQDTLTSPARDRKLHVEFLGTVLRLKGNEEASNKAIKHESSSTSTAIFKTLFLDAELEQQSENIQKENVNFDILIRNKQKELKKITDDQMKLKNSIQTIKRFVKEGRYTTQAELNKKFNMMTKARESEESKVNKIKADIEEKKRELQDLDIN